MERSTANDLEVLIFNWYEDSHNETVSEEEMNLLLKCNYEIFRTKLAKVIIGVVKGVLERERQKPHGVFEIVDTELRIRLNQESYFLCKSFRSGCNKNPNCVREYILPDFQTIYSFL